MESTVTATMIATVTQVGCCTLLVCDHCTSQEVLVHTDSARCFSCGACICIHYNGVMTASNPPQISATCITRISG